MKSQFFECIITTMPGGLVIMMTSMLLSSFSLHLSKYIIHRLRVQVKSTNFYRVIIMSKILGLMIMFYVSI